jgi:hypothetical protein
MTQTLREQQAETARQQILSGVAALLEQSTVDALTMPPVAS